jgi:CBS domain-containing protein
MKAADVMVTDVITVRPEMTVQEVAEILLDNRISAVPVVDADGHLIGIVSEGDLIRRAEIGTDKRRSWWLNLLTLPEIRASEFVKSHARKVADVMTQRVITATEDASLGEIATLLEKHGIKRVPIVRGDRVVGLVSRANLLQAFASSSADATVSVSQDDQAIRQQVLEQIRSQPSGMPWLLTVTVRDGVVELWGPVQSEEQRSAIRVAAEVTPGVKTVKDNLYRWTHSLAE